VRKIFSIVLALGMILALSVIATPAAAMIGPGSVAVSVSNACAGQIGVYNISFDTSASLTEGVHSVCIKFPAGTVLEPTGSPVPWLTGDILIGDDTHTSGVPVFGSEVTVTGTQVCFLVPVTFDPGTLWVYFSAEACVINPPAGRYQLEVWTTRAPDTLPTKNLVPYKISPCYSAYEFYPDFNVMYPGIAAGFVPPFKACGQNMTPAFYVDNITGTGVGGFYEPFQLIFDAASAGCIAPCTEVDFKVSLTASPQFPCGSGQVAHATLNLTAAYPSYVKPANRPDFQIGGDLGMTHLTWDPCTDVDGIPDKVTISTNVAINASPTIVWNGTLHFDTVGEYTICFEADCVGGGPQCTTPDCAAGNVLVKECIDFTVHQWKDAAKVTLDEKWNLISLPLVPFDTDLDAMLASLDTFDYATYFGSNRLVLQDNLLSIWNYDAATQAWKVYGNGQSSLTTIEPGKAYWFRLRYPLDNSLQAALSYLYHIGPPGPCGNYSWWVFGTELPEPPASPQVYPVVAGWNMVGFTSMTNEAASDYLGNWDAPSVIPEPIIMGWNQGCFVDQHWTTIDFGSDSLESGQGYWMAFPFAGSVFQVIP
jgi:hypothetical protein